MGWTVEPISVYTKLLVTARCKYESQTKKRASQYCPGYSDAQRTPFQGSKMVKLRKFSDVFCSSCPTADRVCQQLFCPPEYMIVNIALTMMESLCSELDTDGNKCHNLYCQYNRRKKRLDREMVPPGLNIGNDRNITCKAAGDWSTVAGMDDWCITNCPMGNDDTTCLADYCTCHYEEVTTVPASSLENCANWTASLLYSQVRGMTKWCESVCRLGICPPTHCQCAVVDARPTTSYDDTTFSSHSTANTYTTTSEGFYDSSITSPPSSPLSSTSVPTTHNQPISTKDSELNTSTTSKPTIILSSVLSSSSIPNTAYSTDPQTSLSNTKSDQNSARTSQSTISSSSSDASKSSISSKVPTPTSTLSTFQTESTKWTTQSQFITSPESPVSSSDTSSTMSTTIAQKRSSVPSLSTSQSPPSSTVPTSSQSTAHYTSSAVTSSSSTLPTSLSPKDGSSPTLTATGSSAGTISSLTVKSSQVPVSTTQVFSSTKITTTEPSTSTSTRPPVNETEVLNGGFSVMSNIVCAHTLEKNQSTITKRFCQSEKNEEGAIKTGYSFDIIDRVLKFAPRLMCSFMTESENTNSCSSIFCGGSPIAESVIKSSMCSVCRSFEGSVGSECSLAYCS